MTRRKLNAEEKFVLWQIIQANVAVGANGRKTTKINDGEIREIAQKALDQKFGADSAKLSVGTVGYQRNAIGIDGPQTEAKRRAARKGQETSSRGSEPLFEEARFSAIEDRLSKIERSFALVDACLRRLDPEWIERATKDLDEEGA